MKLGQLLREMPVKGTIPQGAGEWEVTGVVCDSRKVKKGCLFFALPGQHTDGRHFIRDAAARGAVAAVCEKGVSGEALPVLEVENARVALAKAAACFYEHPSQSLKVVGVTGTNGKTTTTFLVRHLMECAGLPCGLIGTIFYAAGRELMPASHTTPEAPDLQALLAGMRAGGLKACAMEISSHALDQHRADGISLAAGIFTNLTQDHLDYHGTMEAYFEAKSKMFENMTRQRGRGKRAIINCDDRYGQMLLERFKGRLSLIRYGRGAQADFRASRIQIQPSGTAFALSAKRKEFLVRSPLIGLFNVYNALAALAAVSACGVDLRIAVEALANAPQVPGRLQRVAGSGGFQVFVDYAHTPDALVNVLQTLKGLNPGRIITVFGCGGDRDKTKRPLMGAAVAEFSNLIVLTSDNPRSEDPLQILRDIEPGLKGAAYEKVPDRAAAIRRAVNLAEEGDIVLIAGKGHETTQEIQGKKLPFDDVQHAVWAMEERRFERR